MGTFLNTSFLSSLILEKQLLSYSLLNCYLSVEGTEIKGAYFFISHIGAYSRKCQYVCNTSLFAKHLSHFVRKKSIIHP